MKLNLIINHTSMEPIYEQIVAQIKAEVIEGTLTAGEALPSVRALSRELKISALTVKKAYDNLEEEGLVVTVHGKGSFIAAANQELLMEERRKELEKELEAAVLSNIRKIRCRRMRLQSSVYPLHPFPQHFFQISPHFLHPDG